MAKHSAYNTHFTRIGGQSAVGLYVFCLLFLLWGIPKTQCLAQADWEYVEISVLINIPPLGSGEIDAVIKGQDLYLPVVDLFSYLKIKNTPTPNLDSITGFFINEQATYFIDRINNRIIYKDEAYDLYPGELIRTDTKLYLKADYFEYIFGLVCKFNFRSMAVTLTTDIQLPGIREIQQQKMRENLHRLQGNPPADTTIRRKHPLFQFGAMDWSANFSQQPNGINSNRANIRMGSMLAGGEALLALNLASNMPFEIENQNFLWRYVNNHNPYLRQVMAGRIGGASTASIYAPILGVQMTNTATTFRRSFGTYTLSDHTEPSWTVELYVNSVLIDYKKADASGFYTFDVPLIYGNTLITLKFYGPWGEERTREQNISIPFNFLPKNTVEYNASAGIIQDSLHGKFSRTSVNYGISRNFTIGGGYEYLSSLPGSQLMPFFNSSLKLASNLLFSGDYTHQVKSSANLSYNLQSKFQFDIHYTKYKKGQQAIIHNYLEERKISLSAPIHIKKLTLLNRLTVNQLVLPTTKYTTSEWMLSGSVFGINTNLSTYAVFMEQGNPYLYGNLSLGCRLPYQINCSPQAQFSYSDREINSVRVRMEKPVFKYGYLSLSYEKNFRGNQSAIEIGFRYDFNFGQLGAASRLSGNISTFTQYAGGSMVADPGSRYFGTSKSGNVGKGGFIIVPFLDINANGRKDRGEPKAPGLKLRASGGKIERNDKDTTIRIMGMEAYTDCLLELDQSSIDNIAWRITHKSLKAAVDPNIITEIDIPIQIVGEAAGMVMIQKDGRESGQGRIRLNFYNKKMELVAQTLSEGDGYFSYLGLLPGQYLVAIDPKQLENLSMSASPQFQEFEIHPDIDGDFIDNLEFTIRKNKQKPENTKMETQSKKKHVPGG